MMINRSKFLIIGFIALCSFAFIALRPKGGNIMPYNNGKVHAPFNKQYKPEELSKVLSWIDCGKGLSAVTYHKGLMIAPMSFDFGGGLGDGAVVAYNVDDPKNPTSFFDSRDYKKKYHDENSPDYLGDISENHGMYFHEDKVLLAEKGLGKAGFLILDLGPLYDNDKKTLPKVVCRYVFPDVQETTVYDGFSFAPAWAGGRYVYAPTGSNGVYIVDTQNLDDPKLVSHLTKSQLYNQTLRSANAIGDLLVLSPAAIASTTADLVFVDVSNPEFPSLLNRHTIKIGYQGIVYGTKFYNGAYSGNRGQDKISEILAYDFTDVNNIKDIKLGDVEGLMKAEYIYVKDEELYIGHYPGLSKWKLENDSLVFDVAVEPQFPRANDYGFVSPLGNLTVVTSDHNVKSRINIGVNQIEPDTKGPELKHMIPVNGQKNVALTTKIGLSFSDFISNETLENKAILLKERGSSKVIPCDFGHGMGIVHAIPKKPLRINATYDVFITNNLKDMVGNSYEGEELAGSFSTGAAFADFSVNITGSEPKPLGSVVKLSGGITNKAIRDAIEYSWNFGDGSPSTPFSSKASIEKTFKTAGNYNIILTARQKGRDKLMKASAVQVVHNKLPETRPSVSGTMVLADNQKELFVVNPDNNTITAFDAKTGQKIYEKRTGKKPVAIARYKDQLWVSTTGNDAITIHNAKEGNIIGLINLGYGKAPHGIVINEADNKCYVALTAIGQLQEIDIKSQKLRRNLQLDGQIRNLSFAPEQQKIIVPQFIATEQKGSKIFWVDAQSFQLKSEKRLQPSLENDGLANGRGYPNYMGPVAINPEQTNIWIPGKKDNLFRGTRRDGKPLKFDHTVRSIAVNMSLNNETELFDARLDLDNSDFSVAAAYNPFGNIIFIATRGSQTIWAVDAYNPSNQSVFNTNGEGTEALLVNTKGNTLYVHNQLSRVVSVYESTPSGSLTFLDKWSLVENESLAEDVLEGKRLFNNASRGSMTQEGYMSCTSCHIDGSHDGRIWDMSNLGEGFRNTIDLRGKAGMKHGMLHWSGNFDEVQDFDNQITKLNEGTGFMFGNIVKKHPQLIHSKFGMHKELDALAAYVASLDEYPKSPYKNADGTMTKSAQKGRKLFIDNQCYKCHAGSTFTDSKTRVLHNIGTQGENTGERLGKKLNGLDTPSLISSWQSAPYLHDGSAATLKDVFYAGNGEEAQAHKIAQQLNTKEMKQVLDFIKQLDSEDGITAKEVNNSNTVPSFEKDEYTFNYAYKYSQREQEIATFKAIDTDKNQNITYTLAPNGHGGLFKLDKKTGKLTFNYLDIYFRNRFNRKYEYHKSYWVDVVATDSDKDFPLAATARAYINIDYPQIPLKNMELRNFLKLHKSMDKKKALTETQQKQMNTFNNHLVTRVFTEAEFSD